MLKLLKLTCKCDLMKNIRQNDQVKSTEVNSVEEQIMNDIVLALWVRGFLAHRDQDRRCLQFPLAAAYDFKQKTARGP